MNIHFIAIGGSIMHNLAISLRNKGYNVSGSDDQIYDPAASKLKKYGIYPDKAGWHPEIIHEKLDAVILGMHARKDNPELLKAKELGLKIYSFPEYVFEQSKDKVRVVVGGSHGKTSTTSMIMHVLTKVGKSFDYLVGSELEGFELMVQISDAPIIIIEGDEYLASPLLPIPKFHLYHPNISVITGIAWDHFNVFPTFENYKEQFEIFINKIESSGHLFYCNQDEDLLSIIDKTTREDIEIKGYNLPEYKIEDGTSIVIANAKEYPLEIFGKYNLQNMEAARNVCESLGIDSDDFYSAMQSFKGAAKRMETVYKSPELKIFRDFAHAPSKLRASVAAVKEQFEGHQLIAAYELHTFSSLNKGFIDQYKNSLDKADSAVVLLNPEVLKQKKLPNISDEDLREYFGKQDLNIVHNQDELLEFLKTQKAEKRVLLMMSSGTFNGLDINSLKNIV